MITFEQGKALVKLTRKAIASKFSNIKVKTKEGEKRGVFVTLHTYPNNVLRGCIGFIDAIYPMEEAIVKAAMSAAFNDPRFPPLQKEELDKVTIEISILTKPELIKITKPEDYLKHIKIPGDGLIINYKGFSGLLLPQVPVEFDWKVEEFLNHTCMKAGLSENKWKDSECSVHKFQVQIFSEKTPNGIIIEKHINTQN